MDRPANEPQDAGPGAQQCNSSYPLLAQRGRKLTNSVEGTASIRVFARLDGLRGVAGGTQGRYERVVPQWRLDQSAATVRKLKTSAFTTLGNPAAAPPPAGGLKASPTLSAQAVARGRRSVSPA